MSFKCRCQAEADLRSLATQATLPCAQLRCMLSLRKAGGQDEETAGPRPWKLQLIGRNGSGTMSTQQLPPLPLLFFKPMSCEAATPWSQHPGLLFAALCAWPLFLSPSCLPSLLARGYSKGALRIYTCICIQLPPRPARTDTHTHSHTHSIASLYVRVIPTARTAPSTNKNPRVLVRPAVAVAKLNQL